VNTRSDEAELYYLSLRALSIVLSFVLVLRCRLGPARLSSLWWLYSSHASPPSFCLAARYFVGERCGIHRSRLSQLLRPRAQLMCPRQDRDNAFMLHTIPAGICILRCLVRTRGRRTCCPYTCPRDQHLWSSPTTTEGDHESMDVGRRDSDSSAIRLFLLQDLHLGPISSNHEGERDFRSLIQGIYFSLDGEPVKTVALYSAHENRELRIAYQGTLYSENNHTS
jgi:hypothetical protein